MQYTQVLQLPEQQNTELVSASDPRSAIVSIDAERMGGEPCFAGTRVPVQYLWDYLAEGENLAVFLDCFPTVSREQALEAIKMAGQRLVQGLPLR